MSKKRTPSVYTLAVEHVQAQPHQDSQEPDKEASPIAKGKGDTAIMERSLERTTLYLHASQSDKLDTLALRFKKQTGKRINRSDIIRRLIDRYDVEQPL